MSQFQECPCFSLPKESGSSLSTQEVAILERGLKMSKRKRGEEETMEGIASIALLPCGFLSGHFIKLPESSCYGLLGTELFCERECSRGEDYRLIKLSILDYASKKERVVVVERRGHDAARLQDVDHAHGWEVDVVRMVEEEHGKQKVSVSFECELLKSEDAAEEHIRKYMPNVAGLDAIVNVGKMKISGLNFEADEDQEDTAKST